MNREKRTYSGKLLDIGFYPVFQDGRRMPSRAPKHKPSTEEQERYNRNQATKELIRKVNANFDTYDYFFHPTYFQECAPQTREAALRDVANYMLRVKRRRQSELKKTQQAFDALPDTPALREQKKELRRKIKKLKSPFRYICIPEQMIYKTGKYAGRANWHFHIFVTGGLDDRTMERLWGLGIRVNANNFQPDRFGPEAAAKYVMKSGGEAGKKKYICSRNLKKPKCPDPSKRDGKTSQYQLERWAKERIDDAEFWERRYRGYRFIKCYASKNPYNGRWYMSVLMYRTNADPPPWAREDWGVFDQP